MVRGASAPALVALLSLRTLRAQQCTTFENVKLASDPGRAAHPDADADIVIGTEADWGDHNKIVDGVLGGFDIELTAKVCAHANVKCAIVTVPWKSVWPSEYTEFGWADNPKTYPGEGLLGGWFHCSVGTRNTLERQQSTSFTNPYTDMSVDSAGFVVPNANKDTFPADAAGKKIGILESQAFTNYFMSQLGSKFNIGDADVTSFTEASAQWAALEAGTVDAIYTGSSEAASFQANHASGGAYAFIHSAAGWSQGVAYGCRPEFGDIVEKLNAGLVAFKADAEYATLCAKYSSIKCDTNSTTFSNAKTTANPGTADHPTERADIVIGTEADWGQHNYITDGQLGGFDIELTNEVCKAANVSCAIVTVPWQSVWPKKYSEFGVSEATQAAKAYPGVGTNSRWYHCSVGTRNTVDRQQSVAFTDPYTDPGTDSAGFVAAASASLAADAAGAKVGILAAQGYTNYFKSQMGVSFNPTSLTEYDAAADLWAALLNGNIDAVYTGASEATTWTAGRTGYSFVHGAAGYSKGVAYGCRPEFGNIVAKLNAGLRAFKADAKYTALCTKYGITCTTASETFANTKTAASPGTADHPTGLADIVIGTEADWGSYNGIFNGSLGGFDIELTKKVCELASVSCAIVTVPWKSVWPNSYTEYGWSSNPKTYPGVGMNSRWFHCSVGTRNMIARQQSVAFTNPYTTVDTAGFVTASANSDFPADGTGKKIGILASQAYTVYFKAQMDNKFKPQNLTEYDSAAATWQALTSGAVDAVYTGASEATPWIADNSGYSYMHAEAGFSNGVAFGCRPEFGDKLAKLNQGLVAFKATAEYTALCTKYDIKCDTASTTFSNTKSEGSPTATHPDALADIVIGTEADWGVYNYIRDGVLGGFDVDLVEAVCAKAGKKCAIVTVPWQSVWPKNNPKTYPGVGLNSKWFHCSVGTRNILARQQSTAFTDPYTDMTVDTAGFVTAASNNSFPANGSGKKIGILAAQAFTQYFKSQMGVKFDVTAADVTEFNAASDVWAALKAGTVHAVYTGKSEATDWIADNSGFELVHAEAGWSKGVAFGCRPEFGATVITLNAGLSALKQDKAAWAQLCEKYPTIDCDCDQTTGTNTDTTVSASAREAVSLTVIAAAFVGALLNQ